MKYITLLKKIKNRTIKKVAFAVTVFSLIPFFAFSTHIIGGELNYKCLGGNLYEVKLRVFRDCNSPNNASYDNPAAVSIFDVNNVLITTLSINFPGATIITPTVAQQNPCVKIPLNTCVEVAEYITTVTLPPRAGGYQLVYQRCCRNGTINNITNPGSQGTTYYAKIPDQSVSCNSNPVFTKMPPLFVCANNPLVFDNSATDADGDSISYNICSPFNGANTGSTQPNPANPPPYNFVTYKAPYTGANPMGGTPLAIDPKTGILTGTPNTLGQFVVGVCANEYRNGVLLSTTKRDFQFNVVSCEPDVAAAAAAYVSDCVNHTVTFTNNSTGSATYRWNFGDPTTLGDTSKLANPTYTYPTSGTFTVSLIAFSTAGNACNDTLKSFVVVIDTCKACAMNLAITKIDATCGVSGPCNGPLPVVDAVSQGIINPPIAGINTITWNHTTSGTNRFMLVEVISVNGTSTGVTYAGLPLTFLDRQSNTFGANTMWVEMYYLIAPPLGVNPVVVTFPTNSAFTTPDRQARAITFTGVHQTTPVAGAAKNSGNTCPTSLSVPSAANELVVDLLGIQWSAFAPAPLAGQVGLYAATSENNLQIYYISSRKAGAAGTVATGYTWTFCGVQPWAMIGTSIKPVCTGGSAPGSATVSPSGGTSPYNYSWGTNPAQTTSTAINLSAGTYTVTVVDAANCIKTSSVIIDAGSTLVLTQSQTPLLTCASSTGTATVTASGGTPPYTYFWNNGQTTSSATGLSAGIYSVNVIDSAGCSKSTTFTILQPTVISATVSKTDQTCSGTSNGTATVTPSGGTGPYTYLWNNGKTTNPATGLSAAYYTVTVTDANGCNTTADVTVANSVLTLSSSKTDAKCFGGNSGTASVTATNGTPGYTYSWNTSPAQTTATAVNLSAGTYVVTVTDNGGCSSSASLTIAQPTLLDPEPSNTSTIDCAGTPTGSANLVVNGGTAPFTYLWCNGQTTSTATALAQGKCAITVTDANLCSIIDTVNIIYPVALSLTKISSDAPCGSVNNGSATITPLGGKPGYTYSWSTNPVQTTQTATGLSGGTYTVIVTDAAGCTRSLSIVINQATAITIAKSSKSPGCNLNNGTASVTASGGTPGYTYSWNTTPVQTAQTATGLSAGTYTVVVTDNAGCTSSTSIIITNSTSPTVSIATKTDVSCNGGNNGSVTSTVSGGTGPYTYSWNTNPVQTTAIIGGLTAGTYTVTVTDNSGCTSNTSVIISQPLVISLVSSKTDATCNGNKDGTATITSSGGNPGYTYSWLPGAQTGQTATGLSAGTYTITVTDSKGCTASLNNIVINQPSPITITNSTTTSGCGLSNGTASVTATGGTSVYTYSWNTNPVQTNSLATGLSAGTYVITVTDNSGCTSSASVLINNSAPAPTGITSSISVTCNGGNNGTATVTPSGGTGVYTYSWNTNPVQTTVSVSGLTAGTYIVTVTDNAGCIFNTTVIVAQPNPINIAQGTTLAGCSQSNGTASVTASGGTPGYTYSWNTSPVQTTQTATNLSAGTYTIVVTDNLGCTSGTSVTVSNPAGPTAVASSVDVSCNGGNNGTVIVIPSGGTGPYTYSWNTSPVKTTASIAGLTMGTYSVTVTDNAGCIFITSVIINQPALITLVSSQTNISCNGNLDGTATVTGSGGNGGYSYSWTPGPQTTQTATGLSAGTYTITVTDAKGCSASLNNVVITQPNALSLVTNSTASAACFGTGTATVTASGGSGTYTYSWNTSPVQTSQTATGLSSGTYTIIVTDANLCTSTTSVLVSGMVSSVVANFSEEIYFNCDGVLDQFFNLSSNATTYLWDFGDGTTSTLKNPTHTHPYGTTVTITLIAMDGACTDTISYPLSVNAFDDYISPSAPNVFTPNDDGTNDCFEIEVGNGLEKCVEIIIFDRWGLRLYDSETGGACWDGRTTSGSLASEGTYFYLVKVGNYEKHGTLTLLR